MNKTQLPQLYKELPELQLSSQFVDPAVYAQAIESLIIVCTDIVFINRQHKTLYLVKRKAKPSATWYMFGGRMKRGETETEAALRNLKKETGLTLTADRLTYWNIGRFWWKDRQQEPQDRGVDALAFMFIVEPTAEELAAIQLDPEEYEAEIGVRAFSQDELAAEKVHPIFLEIYNAIF